MHNFAYHNAVITLEVKCYRSHMCVYIYIYTPETILGLDHCGPLSMCVCVCMCTIHVCTHPSTKHSMYAMHLYKPVYFTHDSILVALGAHNLDIHPRIRKCRLKQLLREAGALSLGAVRPSAPPLLSPLLLSCYWEYIYLLRKFGHSFLLTNQILAHHGCDLIESSPLKSGPKFQVLGKLIAHYL